MRSASGATRGSGAVRENDGTHLEERQDGAQGRHQVVRQCRPE